jgi:KipI family sensor histidine kinase inhibitor
MSGRENAAPLRPDIVPLGDQAMLVRFGTRLDDAANRAALGLEAKLARDPIPGVTEIVPSLVSVLLRYDPDAIGQARLAGEISLRLGHADEPGPPAIHDIEVHFDGPDLAEVAEALKLGVDAFVAAHNARPLRVLTTGFAPGFVYCGFHPEALNLPRRTIVRPLVPAGSVLFAAGQTAMAATEIPTGWHVIGRTEFRNFVPENDPPTLLRAGDLIRFREAP